MAHLAVTRSGSCMPCARLITTASVRLESAPAEGRELMYEVEALQIYERTTALQ
jgi:hypothetical protein